MIIATNKYTKEYWDKINETRRAFQDWINYEWNYAVHFSFHKNYETDTKITEKLVIAYLNDLRRVKKLTFSSFYIIPKSFVDPEFNPHHIHILLLIFNEKERLKILLKDSITKFDQINKCEVHNLYEPEAGTYYVTKFKNLKITDLQSIHYDFYREKLLDKYRNPTGYINDELKKRFQKI